MQFVKGRTMADRLAAEGRLEMDEARRILAEMASAVAAAHKKGIVHRDIRPANVLYEEDTGRTLLADFGIAAVMARGDTDAPSRLTKTGELIGDPAYMSPEQLMGGELNERSDIYALGLLGYELIAGRGPYDTTSKREMFAAHVRDKPRNLTELRHSVDRALADLLERCLAKEPQHRPNASDLYRRLSGPTGESLAADAAEAADSTDFLSTLKRKLDTTHVGLFMLPSADRYGSTGQGRRVGGRERDRSCDNIRLSSVGHLALHGRPIQISQERHGEIC